MTHVTAEQEIRVGNYGLAITRCGRKLALTQYLKY